MYQVAANRAHEGRRRPWARHRPTRVGPTIATSKTAHCGGRRTLWLCAMASGSAGSYRYGPGRVRIARWPHPDFGAKCGLVPPVQVHRLGPTVDSRFSTQIRGSGTNEHARVYKFGPLLPLSSLVIHGSNLFSRALGGRYTLIWFWRETPSLCCGVVAQLCDCGVYICLNSFASLYERIRLSNASSLPIS